MISHETRLQHQDQLPSLRLLPALVRSYKFGYCAQESRGRFLGVRRQGYERMQDIRGKETCGGKLHAVCLQIVMPLV